jgi:hypothetical protein
MTELKFWKHKNKYYILKCFYAFFYFYFIIIYHSRNLNILYFVM